MDSKNQLPRAFRDRFAVIHYCSEHNMAMLEGGHKIVLKPEDGDDVTYLRSSNPLAPEGWEQR